MTSAVSLRAAIHDALKADAPLIALLGGASIYDEPPRDAALPYVTLGEDTIADGSTATEAGEEHALTLHVWSRQGGHKEAHLIAGALLEALAGALLKLAAAAVGWLRERALLAAGEAKGRAASDAGHARTAAEKGERMREIAARPPARTEIERRLEDGTA